MVSLSIGVRALPPFFSCYHFNVKMPWAVLLRRKVILKRKYLMIYGICFQQRSTQRKHPCCRVRRARRSEAREITWCDVTCFQACS